jgi:hypothetical protein
VVKLVDADLSECSNGGYIILTATDSNDNLELDSDDLNIQSGIVCNGLNGSNGLNAPPTPLTPVELIDPCGAVSGHVGEILIRLNNQTIIASFSDDLGGTNTRFAVIGPGNYMTSDGTFCNFTVNSNGEVIW